MAKKVKCMNCAKSIRWALPEVGEKNLEYVKHCVAVAKRSIVCGEKKKKKAPPGRPGTPATAYVSHPCRCGHGGGAHPLL